MGATLQNFINKHVWNFEKRATGGSNMTIEGKFWEFVEGTGGFEKVSIPQAQRISGVYTCLSVRSHTIGSLPINIIKELPNGDRENLVDHPAYYPLAHEPNDYMSSANLMMSLILNMDSYGNSFAYIHRDGRTRPRRFELWCAPEVSINLVEGEAFYTYEGRTYPARDVLHFRMFSMDGLRGLSPITMNAQTMSMAKKLDEFAGYTLGSRPPGVLSYDGNLTPEQQAQNQKTWEQSKANGKTPVLSGNMKYAPTMFNGQDSSIGDLYAKNRRDTLAIWQVPPVFAQDYDRATFSNAEQSDLIYAKHTIMPIVKMMEQEFNMKLFTEAEKKTTGVKMNLNGLLRADTKTRSEFYTTMRNFGIADANEIRRLEDWNSYPGGDIKTIQFANGPVDQLRKYWDSKSVTPEKSTEGAKRDAYEEEHVLN